MFDLATLFWICVGVTYATLFFFDYKVLSKKKTKVST